MKSEKKVLNKENRKKWILLLILLIPFISIILIVTFRHTYAPTNEEILEKIKDIDAYTVKAEYTIKNSKGEYKEETKMYYCKDVGMRIDFGQDRVKIYKDGFISMKDNGDEYELKDNFDSVYPLSFYNLLLSNEIKEIKEETEDWGDKKYLEVSIDLPGSNEHISTAKLYILKDDRAPIVLKIFDKKDIERVSIAYSDFEEQKDMDKSLF